MRQKNMIAFKVLVGSHNYNLQVPESDEDYKVFYYPAFDDLYDGNKASTTMVSREKDVEFHDIRKLTMMLWKANVNFLEVLFSQKIVLKDVLLDELMLKREEIARMNLPYLYDACVGMFFQKRKEFIRDQQLEKVYKHEMTMWRILDFLQRYEQTNFTSFQQSMWYENHDFHRQLLFDIRNKQYTIEEVENMITKKFHEIQSLSSMYKRYQTNEKLRTWINSTIKEYVIRKIKIELSKKEL